MKKILDIYHVYGRTFLREVKMLEKLKVVDLIEHPDDIGINYYFKPTSGKIDIDNIVNTDVELMLKGNVIDTLRDYYINPKNISLNEVVNYLKDGYTVITDPVICTHLNVLASSSISDLFSTPNLKLRERVILIKIKNLDHLMQYEKINIVEKSDRYEVTLKTKFNSELNQDTVKWFKLSL